MKEFPADWSLWFERESAVIYIIDPDFHLIYCNAAWDVFALANGGGSCLLRENQMGRNVLEVVPMCLRSFYTKLYARALCNSDGENHLYECSSDSVLRRLHMNLQQVAIPGRGVCLVVINSVILEEPMRRVPANYDAADLRQENGLIIMCAHCRRTQLPGSADSWVWVPALVRKCPIEVSHGFCPACFAIHYERPIAPLR